MNSAIQLDELPKNCIHARARVYKGPKRIVFGNSVSGEGAYESFNDSEFCENEEQVILDDQIYLFHRNVIDLDAFVLCAFREEWLDQGVRGICRWEHEWLHSGFWKSKNIGLNVVGIDLVLNPSNGSYMKSGNINC